MPPPNHLQSFYPLPNRNRHGRNPGPAISGAAGPGALVPLNPSPAAGNAMIPRHGMPPMNPFHRPHAGAFGPPAGHHHHGHHHHHHHHHAPPGNLHQGDRHQRSGHELTNTLSDPSIRMPSYKESGGAKTLTLDAAVVKLVEWLSSDVGERRATRGLTAARRHARHALASGSNLPRVPFEVFATLDNAIFMGLLQPAVFLSWMSGNEGNGEGDVMGETHTPGQYRDRRTGEKVGRVACLLNPRFFSKRQQRGRKKSAHAADEAVAMLLHQMVHAFFLLCCGTQAKGGADGRLKHGEEFWKVLYAICDVSEDDLFGEGEGAMPFGEVLVDVHKWDDRDGLYVPLRLQAIMDEENYHSSICHTGVRPVPDRDEVDKWYKKVAKAAKDTVGDDVYSFDGATFSTKATPRSQKSSPVGYVEVIWNAMPFDYKRKNLERHFASLMERFSNGKRVWPLPRGVDARSFRILDSFLKNGIDYTPEMLPLPPPGIPLVCRPRHSEDKDTLWTDIRAYKLGLAVEFPELSEHALRRLKIERKLHSNPLDALSEIYVSPSLSIAAPARPEKLAVMPTSYDSPAPPDELREWAKSFMMATYPGAHQGGYYSSNLFAIEKWYHAGVEGLIKSSQSRELEQDYGLALSALWKVTPASAHPPGGMFRGGGEAFLSERPVDPTAMAGVGFNNRATINMVEGARNDMNIQILGNRLSRARSSPRRDHSPGNDADGRDAAETSPRRPRSPPQRPPSRGQLTVSDRRALEDYLEDVGERLGEDRAWACAHARSYLTGAALEREEFRVTKEIEMEMQRRESAKIQELLKRREERRKRDEADDHASTRPRWRYVFE